jgi:hypothetical protein
VLDERKKAATGGKRAIESDADRHEKELRKREGEKREKDQEMEDKATLAQKKAGTKKEGKPTKKTKKQAKVAAAEQDLKERVENKERKEAEREKDIEARRELLIAEGLTTVKLLDDDDHSEGSDDMEWDYDQWEVKDHAVDWKTAKGNFRVIIGMRQTVNGAVPMWMWGRRNTLLLDGMDRSNLDACINDKCDHPIYREHLNKVSTKKKTMEVEKPKKKIQCDHSSYDLGVSYHADPEVNPGWCAEGKFLFGVECAGCGSPFVQKAPQACAWAEKEPGDPQVPSTTNAVYCCNNLRNRNGSSGEGCSHAYCKRCWDTGVLNAAESGGPRASRRKR